MNSIVIYGGSFDPVHNGHIHTALNIHGQFNCDRFIFLPCKLPILKNTTTATAEQRVQMLHLALQEYPFFSIDLREIQRTTPSYMVDTLCSFRQELGDTISITLLLGEDAFLQFDKWHEWQRIISLSHLMVMHRPDLQPGYSSDLENLYSSHKTSILEDLNTSASGKIYEINAGNYQISSTWVRSQLQQGKDVSGYAPKTVLTYIQEQNLFK